MFQSVRLAVFSTLAAAPAFATAAEPPVRDAAEALASLGVVTHLDYRETPYADIERVASALAHLGIKRVRDMVPDANARPYEHLAALDVGFNLVVRGGKVSGIPATIAKVEALQARFPGSVVSIEGLNEPNLWPASLRDLTGFEAATTVQRELFAAVKGSPALRTVPVYALSLGGVGEKEFLALGDLSDAADAGNAHVYFGTRPPTATFDFATRLAHHATPKLDRMVVTETGYASAGKPGSAVNEAVQARYILMLIAEAWRRGTPATYLYQLVDDKLDPNDWSRNLGLYRNDWTAKPSAEAVHHLTAAVGEIASNRKGAVCTTDLQWSGPVQKNAISTLRLGAPAGCGLLVWLDQPLWDNASNAPLTVESRKLKFVPTPLPSAIYLVDPLDGSKRKLKRSAGGFEFALGDHPVLLHWH